MSDFERMAANVRLGAQPWMAGWNKLVANPHSQSSWKPRPATIVNRGGAGAQNYPQLYNDIHAAYQNALRWKISGTRRNADTARDILNAWSAHPDDDRRRRRPLPGRRAFTATRPPTPPRS